MATKAKDALKKAVDNEQSRRAALLALGEYMRGTREGMFGTVTKGRYRSRRTWGANWLGIRPEPGDPRAAILQEKIEQAYLFQNIVGGVVSHHATGVVGRDLDYDFAGAATTLLEEAENGVAAWFEAQDIQGVIQDATETLQWAALEGEGKNKGKTTSCLRAFVPPRNVETDPETLETFVEAADNLGEALNKGFRLMHPEPHTAGIIYDDDGEPLAGYYRYSEKVEGKVVEKLELSIVDRDLDATGWGWKTEPALEGIKGDTILQIRSGKNWETIESETPYPIGGELMIVEMSKPPLIDQDVQSQQNAANTNLTYMMHNGETAFAWRVITNAKKPADGKGLETGAGKVTFATGVNQHNDPDDPSRATGVAAVGVYQFPTQPPDPYINAFKASEYAIYDRTSQLHRLISGDATATGVSRIQALAEFTRSLQPTATQVRRAARWVYQLALYFGAYLMQNTGRYDTITIAPKVQFQIAPPTPEETAANIQLYDKGVIDITELMRRSGVLDVVAMQEAIERERKARDGTAAGSGNNETNTQTDNQQGNDGATDEAATADTDAGRRNGGAAPDEVAETGRGIALGA